MQIKTNFIIICDQAFLTAGSNNLNLIGIFTQINAAEFPARYARFALVANFEIAEQGNYALDAIIQDTDGQAIAQAHVPVSVASSPFQVITHFENLAFPKPGPYTLSLSLDREPIGSRVLTVAPVIRHKANLA